MVKLFLIIKAIKTLTFKTIYDTIRQRKYNMKNRKPFFRFCKSFIKIFKRKPKVINFNDEELDDCAIYLSNHSGASGPLTHELYFPKNFRFWGTHEMCGTMKERWDYLANIYFYQKKHINKFLSKIIATIATPVLYMFYKGMQIIPTYTDSRLRKSLQESYVELNKGNSVIIFPENSSDGYHKELKQYFAGFMLLAKSYYKKYGISLKIYNMYYCKKYNTVLIDKFVNYKDLIGKDEDSVAESFKNRANEMYKDFLLQKKSKK